MTRTTVCLITIDIQYLANAYRVHSHVHCYLDVIDLSTRQTRSQQHCSSAGPRSARLEMPSGPSPAMNATFIFTRRDPMTPGSLSQARTSYLTRSIITLSLQESGDQVLGSKGTPVYSTFLINVVYHHVLKSPGSLHLVITSQIARSHSKAWTSRSPHCAA